MDKIGVSGTSVLGVGTGVREAQPMCKTLL